METESSAEIIEKLKRCLKPPFQQEDLIPISRFLDVRYKSGELSVDERLEYEQIRSDYKNVLSKIAAPTTSDLLENMLSYMSSLSPDELKNALQGQRSSTDKGKPDK